MCPGQGSPGPVCPEPAVCPRLECPGSVCPEPGCPVVVCPEPGRPGVECPGPECPVPECPECSVSISVTSLDILAGELIVWQGFHSAAVQVLCQC